MSELELEPKAMYNLLRMNWQRDSELSVEPWQVEDYRAWPLERLFSGLESFDLQLDEHSFIERGEEFETPEEMSEFFISEEVEPEREDQAYLIFFELWRRLTPEKQSLSVFCDELDHRIHQYDLDPTIDAEGIQDALDSLLDVLEQNTDSGADPQEVFAELSAHCANDLEKFLYDFISDEIDSDNESYASDLVDDFSPFVEDNRWFDLLQVRLWAHQDADQADEGLEEILEECEEDPDLDLYFEILEYLSHGGNRAHFILAVKQTLPLLEDQQDTLDLLRHCAAYYSSLDDEVKESAIERLIESNAASIREPLLGIMNDEL